MRAVLDTNVVLSALLFENGRLSWLQRSWTQGDIMPLVNRAIAEELLRVLGYPKFKLERAEIDTLIGNFLPYAETITASVRSSVLPRCTDPHDQKFLELAQAGRADALVSGDKALLNLRGKTPFDIITPESLRRRLHGT